MNLLPCPWCRPRDGVGVYVCKEGPHVYVECARCGVRGPSLLGGRARAVKAWDQLAAPSAPDPLREALMWEHAGEYVMTRWASLGPNAMMMGTAMVRAAHIEVERLLREVKP